MKTYQFSIPIWLELNTYGETLPEAITKLLAGNHEINEGASMSLADPYMCIQRALNAVRAFQGLEPGIAPKVVMETAAYEDGEDIAHTEFRAAVIEAMK